MSFECTYDQFKKIASDFFKYLPECDSIESVDTGSNCVFVHYLNIITPTDLQLHEARVILDLVTKYANDRQVEILKKGIK